MINFFIEKQYIYNGFSVRDPTVLMILVWRPIVEACYFGFQWFHVIQISRKLINCGHANI